MLNKEQRDYLLPKAYNAALRAGAAILEIYKHDEDYDVSIKDDKTPITIADRRAHYVIREYLSRTHVPLMSEEGREMLYEERRGWDLFWLVDPLDGTKEFIKGNGEFTVNIALLVDNVPYLSVVYVPYTGKMYFACRGMGAFVKERVKPIADADFSLDDVLKDSMLLPLTKELNKPLRIAVSRSHNTDETWRYVNIIKMRYPDAQIIEQGSSYKFCMLAEGIVDCYVRTTNTCEWDTAAGELVLELAGGSTRSLPDKERLEYNKLSLLNPHFICRSKYMKEVW